MFCYREGFSLKKIPNIQALMIKEQTTSKSDKKRQEIKFLKFEDLVEFLKIPSQHRSTFDHRLIFLAFSGLRFQSSLDLKINSCFVKKSCKRCKDFKVCAQPTSDCFNCIRILNTKTTEHVFPILPQAWESYQTLYSDHNNTSQRYNLISNDFNKTLKEKLNLTSHSLRKFLPNLMTDFSSACNTGNWKGASGYENMRNFYLQKNFKYVVLYTMLRHSGLSC